jgi:hypothetical protein
MPETHGTIPHARDRKTRLASARRLRPRAIVEVSAHTEEEEEPALAPGFLEICWPALFGILLAVIAPRIFDKVLREWGELGERLVFPFVILAGRPEFGFGAEASRGLPDLVLYLTFPIFGFYAMWNLSRRVRISTTMVQVVFVNMVAAFVLWLLSMPGASHGM